MIQIGVVLIALAIKTFLSGDAASALFILSLGLHFMCTKKADLNMKVTLKSLFTPVEGSEDGGVLEVVIRIAANTAFAGGIAIFLSQKLGLL